MRGEQDWCLNCGAGAPGSLTAHAPVWRSTAAVLAAVALLVAGASAAAYAALSKSSGKPHTVTTLARSAVPPAGTPGAALPPSSTATPPPVVPKVGALGALKTKLPLLKPKTPLVGTGVKAPVATTPAASTPAATAPSATGEKAQGGGGSTPAAEKGPAAIVLDTNAASNYNPYAYPASNFGDPSLAIDGETATSWSAQVDPALAPKMAEGLLLDLKSGQRLSALVLTTATPGMTLQVYGTTASTVPSTITDPAWVHLSRLLVAKKRTTRIALTSSKQAFRFVTLWITKAPASALGTPSAPGHVRVNEIELFPAR
jgi:hypothetical protein